MSRKRLIQKSVMEISEMMKEEIEDTLNERENKRVWVREWINQRSELGASSTLLKELILEDKQAYRNHLRLSPENFDWLLHKIAPSIQRAHTKLRNALPAQLKLEATLRYLASGDSFASIEYLYRIPKSTFSTFLPEVLDAIYASLGEYIKVPQTTKEWKKIQHQFSCKWDFVNCCGALDGKHMTIKCPPKSGSDFYNYKATFSVILLALVDGDYCFSYIDVGSNGRCNDTAVFSQSKLSEFLEKRQFGFPQDGIIVADDAFPLKPYLLKPYSHYGSLTEQEMIFNYRLSRARRIVENAFAEDLVKGNLISGSWRMNSSNSLRPGKFGTNNASRLAMMTRNHYAEYFMNEGAVPWQRRMVGLE